MSTKVSILCEDPTDDRYILEPVVTSALKAIGVSHPRVSTITNPRTRGFTTLLREICPTIQKYHKTVAVLVIAFDLDGGDGLQGRRDQVARVEHAVAQCEVQASNIVLLGSVMEAEVYAVWGRRNSFSESWSDIRAERDPKERFFEKLLSEGDSLSVDGGRNRLIRLSLRAGWPSLRGACAELQQLEADLSSALGR